MAVFIKQNWELELIFIHFGCPLVLAYRMAQMQRNFTDSELIKKEPLISTQ